MKLSKINVKEYVAGMGKEVREGVERQKATPAYVSREYKWAEKGRKIRKFLSKFKIF